MEKYKLTEDGVQNTETTAFIPNDENNGDWIEYQNWLKGLDKDGEDLGSGLNTPAPQFTTKELEEQVQQEQNNINEQKIQDEIRKIAIENLKKSGSLPEDYNG